MVEDPKYKIHEWFKDTKYKVRYILAFKMYLRYICRYVSRRYMYLAHFCKPGACHPRVRSPGVGRGW